MIKHVFWKIPANIQNLVSMKLVGGAQFDLTKIIISLCPAKDDIILRK